LRADALHVRLNFSRAAMSGLAPRVVRHPYRVRVENLAFAVECATWFQFSTAHPRFMAKTAVQATGDQTGDNTPGADAALLPDNYEAALAELESLVARMEEGALSLEESLAAYRRGATLVGFCQQQLEKVEQQVRVLDGETLKPLPADVQRATQGAGAATDNGDDL
jgi:exodeoxyribonuclease VII small subunit